MGNRGKRVVNNRSGSFPTAVTLSEDGEAIVVEWV